MDVRMLVGPYRGEIRDIENETAGEMLRDGRAENPYLDPVVIAVAAEVLPDTKRRKRGRL